MGFAVVHMQKIKGGGVRGIQSHNNREHPPKTNPDIDFSRTAENYDLIYHDNYYRGIKQTIESFATQTNTVRKDAVVMCSFIVTSDEQTMKAMSEQTQREFFNDSLQWFAERYGGSNIINATVHMDETTPHMHLGIVPITEDGRLSAKSIFTRKELTEIQTDFSKEVGAKYGLERGKEGSERKHLSEQQFKLQKANEKFKEIESKMVKVAQRAENQSETIRKGLGYIESLDKKKASLESDIAALEGQIEGMVLSIKEISSINPQRTVTGAYKGITESEIQNLKKTAIKGLQYEYEYKKLEAEYEKVKRLVPPIQERIQAEKNKERILVLEKALDALPVQIREQILPEKQKKKSQNYQFER